MYQRILVGTNGTETANRAVRAAAELARLCDATLVVASASALTDDPGDDPVDVDTALGSATDAVAGLGVVVETVRLEGDASEALVAHAAATDVDLVVVGNVGLGGLRGRILGSVPGAVVDDVTCSVLVVRTTD